MGYALSWAALKNGTLEMICTAGDLRPTGGREEVPESNVVATEIPSRWHLVLYKGPRRVWWTPDTLAKESPFPYASSKEKERAGFEIEFALFNKWCNENYTNPDSGRAMLAKFDVKMLHQQLEGYEYVKFFRLRSASRDC